MTNHNVINRLCRIYQGTALQTQTRPRPDREEFPTRPSQKNLKTAIFAPPVAQKQILVLTGLDSKLPDNMLQSHKTQLAESQASLEIDNNIIKSESNPVRTNIKKGEKL